jgi:RND family efflux transporter MFP subunit
VAAARAALDVATKEFDRQKRLRDTQFISQAALDRAEAEFKATQAQVNAQLASAGVAKTQTGFHVVTAPYAGVVAEVPVALGDMATPGRPLLTLYDPAALRVTAALPQSQAAAATAGAVKLEVPGLAGAAGRITPSRVQVLPMADASTPTVTVRADLPGGLGAVPGQFARLWLQGAAAPQAGASSSLSVPASAVVRRAELFGVYVIGEGGKPLLRQVRLGRSEGDRVEVLAGLMPGERVATDPQAAARVR